VTPDPQRINEEARECRRRYKKKIGEWVISRSGEREREGGHTWGNRAEREVRNGKAKGRRESGICRGRRRMDGLGEEEWG
jgi:hypothetical protein